VSKIKRISIILKTPFVFFSQIIFRLSEESRMCACACFVYVIFIILSVFRTFFLLDVLLHWSSFLFFCRCYCLVLRVCMSERVLSSILAHTKTFFSCQMFYIIKKERKKKKEEEIHFDVFLFRKLFIEPTERRR
jgi:hypothetical protein